VVPITEWQGWRLLRISIWAYTARADVDHLLDGLRAIVSRQRGPLT
jgi:hypothetical protein